MGKHAKHCVVAQFFSPLRNFKKTRYSLFRATLKWEIGERGECIIHGRKTTHHSLSPSLTQKGNGMVLDGGRVG